MGLGRLFNKVHKRKRTTTSVITSCEQEVGSPIFSNLEEAAGSTDLAITEADTDVAEYSFAHHDDDPWYHGIRENQSDLECSGDVDDDDEERLSCISNVNASSELQNGLMYHSDRANSEASNPEEIMNFEDEQGDSMELDIDNTPQLYNSRHCLSLSSPETGFLHSSGRPTLQQEALYGTKKRTIDSEFEEYFASLLLK